MSHFTTIKTKWTDQAAMCEALRSLGFSVQHSKTNSLEIKNYYGGIHETRVCIRARATGQLSGKSELGLARQSDGTLAVVMDNMDERREWYKQLPKKYSYAKTMAELRAKGYSVVDEKHGEHIHIRVVKHG